MATVIRMSRGGKTHQPFYSIVVSDQDHPRDGRFTEKLGTFNPLIENGLVLQKDRYEHWLKLGAKPSDTVRTLVKKHAGA